jgi:hypothetical protein
MSSGFRKGNVAVVLDDEAVEAGAGVSSSVRERPRVDRLDPAARKFRRSRQGEKVDHADQRSAWAAEQRV